MNCRNCNYKSESADIIICSITGEEHDIDSKCDCDIVRLKRDKEARLKADSANSK